MGIFIEGHNDNGSNIIINCDNIVDVAEISNTVGYRSFKCRVNLLNDKHVILYESYDSVKKTLDYAYSRNRKGVFRISDGYKPVISEASASCNI